MASELCCNVCFDDCESSQSVKCKYLECGSVICYECLEQNLNVSKSDKQIPKCTNGSCSRFLLLNQVPEKLKKLYFECCFLFLYNKFEENAQKRAELERRIDSQRQIRQEFIENRFPKAIALTAKVILPAELKRIEKGMKDNLENELAKATRICMISTCKGFLDENFRCSMCETTFCKECEHKLKPGHKCNKEDVESIKIIRSMIKCPKCNFTIQKSEGCNNMTCSHCGQNFIYSSGEAGGSGSHNAALELIETQKISSNYSAFLKKHKLYKAFVDFEGLEPPTPKEQILYKMIVKCIKEDLHSKRSFRADLAKKFESYTLSRYKNKEFQNVCEELEELLRKENLNRQSFDSIISKYNP